MQNKLIASLLKIQQGLDKLDHRHYESLLQKVDLLEACNDYGMARKTLKNMLDFNQSFQGEIIELGEVKEDTEINTQQIIKQREENIKAIQKRIEDKIAREREDER